MIQLCSLTEMQRGHHELAGQQFWILKHKQRLQTLNPQVNDTTKTYACALVSPTSAHCGRSHRLQTTSWFDSQSSDRQIHSARE